MAPIGRPVRKLIRPEPPWVSGHLRAVCRQGWRSFCSRVAEDRAQDHPNVVHTHAFAGKCLQFGKEDSLSTAGRHGSAWTDSPGQATAE